MEIIVSFSGKKAVNAKLGDHTVVTDQPLYAGGENQGPSPFALFLSSIGTCAGVYIRSFCEQRSIPVDDIRIIQRHFVNPSTQMIESIDLSVELPDGFPEKYKDAVIKAADQCAVKKHLMHPPHVNISATTI